MILDLSARMKKSLLIPALLFAACSSPKTPAADDFSSLADVDTKSDAFSKRMNGGEL